MTDDRVRERVRQIKAELRRQRDPAIQRQVAEERRRKIAAFEARYGIRSEEIHQAIDEGRLHETFDVNEWLHLWEIEQWARQNQKNSPQPEPARSSRGKCGASSA